MLSLLLIGDIHAGKNNLKTVKSLFERIDQMLNLFKSNNKMPNAIVFMGDLYNNFENININAHTLVSNYLISFSKILSVIVLVGNHDRANATDFQSNVHPFTGLSANKHIIIVEKTRNIVFMDNVMGHQYRFVFVPYVQPGRFMDALNTLNKPFNDEKEPTTAIFCHQEFYGAHLGGGKTSEIGDKWDPTYPFVFSGHIHQYDQLAENVMYVGTPYQVTYSESTDKAIILASFESPMAKPTHVRMNLSLTNKATVRVSAQDIGSVLEKYDKPSIDKDQIKIIIQYTSSDDIKQVQQLLHECGFTNVHCRLRPGDASLYDRKCGDVGYASFKDIWMSLLGDDRDAIDFVSSIRV